MFNSDQPQINFYSGEFKKQAYSIYEKLRNEHPIYPITMPTGHTAWVFTRYEDCVNILKDKRLFKNPASIPSNQLTPQNMVQDDIISIMYHSMFTSDPPDHTRLREIAHKAFTPKIITELKDCIQEIADELLNQVKEKGEMELIEDFAFPLPIIVICDLLGIPKEDRNLFRKWSNTILENQNDPSKFPIIRKSFVEFLDYMKIIFNDRKKNPQNDLVTALVQAEENGEKLSENELYATVYVLIVAGHETVVNLIGNGTLALLENPDQLIKLKEQPKLIQPAVEELLRYSSPLEVSTDRWIGEEIKIYGHQLKPGDMAIAVLASANRDERKFKQPKKLDITRDPNKHIAFGNGIHYCLGAPLARLEGKIAFSSLLHHMPNLELKVDPSTLHYQDTFLVRGLKELPLQF